jgi:hypothetical protein
LVLLSVCQIILVAFNAVANLFACFSFVSCTKLFRICVCGVQDILDFDAFFKAHADSSIDTGIRLVNSMTFTHMDSELWNMKNPGSAIPAGNKAFRFHYKLSM